MEAKSPKILLIFSIIFFGMSLFLPAYTVNYISEYGMKAFLFGWFSNPWMFSWLANPLLFASWFTYRTEPKATIGLSIIILSLMLSFLFVKKIMVDTSGHLHPITGYGPAYFLWIISSVLILIGSLQK